MLLTASLGLDPARALTIVVAAPLVYLAVIVLTRVAGVRSLATMSSFDFAATVAIGSIIATVSTGSTPLLAGLTALAALFGLQFAIAALRRGGHAGGVFDNEPILLMEDGRLRQDNLDTIRLSRRELWSQLRLAGISRLDEVGLAVMETTGEISVLRTGEISPELRDGIRGD